MGIKWKCSDLSKPFAGETRMNQVILIDGDGIIKFLANSSFRLIQYDNRQLNPGDPLCELVLILVII